MIVITGAAGFIGSALVWKFNELGRRDILAVDKNVGATQRVARTSPKWNNLKKRHFETYLESGEFIRRLEKGEWNGKIAAIFHLGACSDTTEKNMAYLRENNTEFSERLTRWAIDHDVYLAYASSAATYGTGELGFSDKDSLTPKLKPLNPYGRSKLDFDLWVLRHGHEKRVTGYRYFNVYGPNEYHKREMRSLVHKGFEQIGARGCIRLFKSYKPEYPDGGQKRDFVYVKDVVDAMIWCYEHPSIKGIYNMGSGTAETWNELAKSLFSAMGKPFRIDYIEMPEAIKPHYQYLTEADMTKFRNTGCPVRFRPLREGVRDYLQNHLQREDPYL